MAESMQSADRPAPLDHDDAIRLHKWQVRLLPLIVRILFGVTIFFFLVSLIQISYLHRRIEQTPSVDLREPLRLLTVVQSESIARREESSALMINALLEANALDRRYHQAGVVLMARVWTSYLGFVTGMALSLLGAAFILGRVQGPSTTLKADVAPVRAELATAAPGIVLSFLGVILMIATLFVKYQISVSDAAVYVGSASSHSSSVASSPPSFQLPIPLEPTPSALKNEDRK